MGTSSSNRPEFLANWYDDSVTLCRIDSGIFSNLYIWRDDLYIRRKGAAHRWYLCDSRTSERFGPFPTLEAAKAALLVSL